MQDLVTNKSKLIIQLEDAKRRNKSRRDIEALASTAAVLETRLAGWHHANGRPEEGAVSLISAASCLIDARRNSESQRLLQRALTMTQRDTLRAWIREEVARLSSARLPGEVFQTLNLDIVGNNRLRIPQVESYMAARRHFAHTKEHAIIQLPVGCGKTGTMALLPFGIAQGRALVITPNLEIRRTVEQNLNISLQGSFYRRTRLLTNGNGPISAVLDAEANIHDCDSADILVTNIQQLVAGNSAKWLDRYPADYFDMIMVDEGHHNVAPSWQGVFERFPGSKITSFTATPLRADGKEVEGKRIYRFPIAEAIREGYVRDLASRHLEPTELYFEYKGSRKRLSLEEILKLREKDWFSKGVALARECNESIVDASLQCMQELRRDGQVRHQIIAAACSIDHAKSIRSLYAERGCNADVLHSDMEMGEQASIRKRLIDGQIDVIVHVQMLGEGADYPNLGVAAIFRPYRHLVPYVQFVGRVMRVAKEKAPGDPDNRAYIVSHVGLNIDRWWEELRKLDQDDQEILKKLANVDSEFINPINASSPLPRRRFRHPMQVFEDVVERFLEVGFLESDANALVDDIVQALDLRGVSFETLNMTREELKRRILGQFTERRTGLISKTAVQPQKQRQETRTRLDERVKAAAKELLNELRLKIVGRELLPFARKHNPNNNLTAAVILINLEIQNFLGTGSKERDLLSLEELDRAYSHMDDIVDKVVSAVTHFPHRPKNGKL